MSIRKTLFTLTL